MQIIKKKIYLVFFLLLITNNCLANEVFISLKKNKINVRYGPSFESDIKYVYKKKNLPLKQIDKKENFRRIVDLKNNSGWIHSTQLKKSNSIIILENKILFKKPSNFSKPIAKVQTGRVLILEKCISNWCKIKTGNFKGWIKINKVWGFTN